MTLPRLPADLRTRRARTHLRSTYREQGFVVLPGLLPPAAVEDLRTAVEVAPERAGPGDNPLSLGPMRFASNLFYGSDALRAHLSSDPLLALATALAGPDLWVRWDQAVWKGPGAPEFPLHQDNGYTGLEVEHLQLWIALTPMTADDGGLVVVPGGHRRPLPHEAVGNHVRTEAPGPTRILDAEAGDVIAFSSLLPHATGPNIGDRTRVAYVAEFLPWRHPDPSVPLPHLRLRVRPPRRSGFVAAHRSRAAASRPPQRPA